MKIAFLVQNLSHASDSVGYDCIFQYRILREIYPEEGNVRIFSVVFNRDLHVDVDIEPFAEFWDYIRNYPEAYIIYHFCDGWHEIDKFLRDNVKNAIVRWHNNTPPWFYTENNIDFAAGCTQGFEIIADLARSRTVRFMVNSEFTRRQLQALDGLDTHIDTVFPASAFLLKNRSVSDALITADRADRPIRLLFVGRVVPHKGHRHILSIAAAVQRFSGRQVKVTFAGALEDRLENYWSDLHAIAIRLGVETEIPGLVSPEELKQLYQSCDAFLCMSEHEGFGMPVFEAMRSRVPVIAWSSSAMADLLTGHPFANSSFQIHFFAACVLAALEPGIRQHVIDYQDEILAQYTYDSVRTQLLDALAHAQGQHGDRNDQTRRAGSTSTDAITVFVRNLADWLEDELGNSVETFIHDAAINYMGLYDIAAHKRLISLLRTSHQSVPIPFSFAACGDLDALHKDHALIHKVMQGEDGAEAIHNLDDLLAFDDEVFIRLCFQKLLGRTPDPLGLASYLRQLRRGADKLGIIRGLAGSAEARTDGRTLPGLKDSHETADNLIRAEGAVRRIKEYLIPDATGLAPYHPMGSIHHVDDLLQLNDAAFVDMSYHILMGKAADKGGMEHYIAALRQGLTRHALLRELSKVTEAAANIAHLDGLATYLDQPQTAEPTTLPQRLARLNNELGQLTNHLVVQHDSAQTGNIQSASATLLRLADTAVQATQTGMSFDTSRLDALLEKAATSFVPPPPSSRNAHSIAQTGEIEFEYLHQIFITANGKISDEMPLTVQYNIESFRQFHPEAQYCLWNADDLRRFIATNFERPVLDAFDTLQAFALKADLGRYCLLYVYGGIYSDLSNRFVSRWRIKAGKTIACFREHKPLHGALWMNQNTIIYAAAGQAEIKLAIDLVVENVLNRDYGVSSLAPSGPVLFGRAIAVIGQAEQYQIGKSINVQVEGALNRATYVDTNGSMIAIRLQGGGGKPSEIGLRGTNVYGEMWDSRKIYGEGLMFFAYDSPAIVTTGQCDEDGIYLHVNAELALSPFALPKGLYAITWRFADHMHGHDFSVIVRDGDGALLHHEQLVLDEAGQADHLVRLTAGTNVGIVLQWGKQARAVFKDVIVRYLSSNPTDMVAARRHDNALTPTESRRNLAPILHLHHILYDADHHLEDGEQEELAGNLQIAAALHPGAQQRVWTDIMLRDFIAENFAVDVVAAYDRLSLHANRSELGRYCLLYVLGGLYVDPWLRMVNPIDVPHDKAMAACRSADVEDGASWAVDTSLLYAGPRQAELEQLIEQIVDGTRSEAYGTTPTSITGAERLGRILAANHDAHNYFGGEVIALTQGMPVLNSVFLSQDGRIIAVNKNNNGPAGRIWQDARRAWHAKKSYSGGFNGLVGN